METVSSKQPKNFFIQETLIGYFEDLKTVLKRLEKDEKTYSGEEVLAKIKSWQKQQNV